MTNHPIPQSTSKPIVLADRFHQVIDQIVTESREAAAFRDGLDREITAALADDHNDEAEEQRLEHQLAVIKARRAERGRWLSERSRIRQAADAHVERLEADAREALVTIERLRHRSGGEVDGSSSPASATRTDPVLPPGVVPVDGNGEVAQP